MPKPPKILGYKCRVHRNKLIVYSDLAKALNLPKTPKIHILADMLLTTGEAQKAAQTLKIFEVEFKTRRGCNFETVNKNLAETWRIVFATEAESFWLQYEPKTKLFTLL